MPFNAHESQHSSAEPAPPRDRNNSQDETPRPSDVHTVSLVRRMAILGNVSVGKTCLLDRLSASGEHSANIPGSTLTAHWGILTVGPGGAPRAFRRECTSCPSNGGRRRRTRGAGHPCSKAHNADPSEQQQCPALKAKSGNTLEAPVVTQLYDTPGSATLAANGEDEMVARDLILSGDMDGVILVADAKNLRRSLALALEAAEFRLPMVLDINMLDEAESMGLDIDDAELCRILGVPVARTVAVENFGVRRLAELALDSQVPKRLVRFPDAVEKALTRLEEILPNPVNTPRALGILLLAGDQGAKAWIADHLGEQALERASAVVEEVQGSFHRPLRSLIADTFHGEAGRIADRVVTRSPRGPSLLVRFGSMAQRPLSGTLIGLIVLVLTYYWVGAFGATYVVDSLSTHLFHGFLIPLFERLVAPIPSAFIRDAIMDPDFGLLPTGLFSAVGIVLPVLFCFYLLQAVLEDSGYLPRLGVLLDRLFRWLGLNGQALIPLILGFSCITMAVITTRMLPTRKERLILTLLLILGIPCAPMLAVMLVIVGKLPWTAAATVFGVIGAQILSAGYLASKLIPGKLPDLILEIPQMRIPRPRVLLAKTWRRTSQFMREAVPIFLLASLVVFLFDRAGGLDVVEHLARPLVHGLLGLPDQAAQIFIKTAIRRESGATELSLLSDQLDNVQLVVTLLVIPFVMPCINATIVIIKQRGLKATMALVGTVMVWAIIVGTLANFVCRSLGITFT